MGSSNFLPWDQPQTNMQDDATYAADAARENGGTDGVEFPSVSFNKFALQASGMAYAIGQFLASKAFVVADSDLPAVVAALQTLFANVPGRGQLQQLGYSPLQNLNVGNYLGFELTLAGNSGLTITGVNAGDNVVFMFVQDAAGGHTVVWPANTSGMVQPDPSPNAISLQVARASADLVLRASSPMISSNGMVGMPIGAAGPTTGAFTTLTANTPAPGDDSTKVATTAFVAALQPSSGSTASGYWVKDQTGHIHQWGQNFAAPGLLTFPIPFTDASSISVMAIMVRTSGGETTRTIFINPDSGANSFSLDNVFINVSNDAAVQVSWTADGF
jgi:hypothetical protein